MDSRNPRLPDLPAVIGDGTAVPLLLHIELGREVELLRDLDTMTTNGITPAPTRYLDVPGGHLADDDKDTGPLVLCVHGLGAVRASYRFLISQLVAAGYRVVTMDLRGDCGVGWTDYRYTAIAGDALALVGSSYGGAAVAYAAATEPAAVHALVLLDAFVRDVSPTALRPLAVRAVAASGAGA